VIPYAKFFFIFLVRYLKYNQSFSEALSVQIKD